MAIGCVGGGNRILACYKASLITFGEALNLIWNPSRDKIFWVVGFWIWVMMVIMKFVKVCSGMIFVPLKLFCTLETFFFLLLL